MRMCSVKYIYTYIHTYILRSCARGLRRWRRRLQSKRWRFIFADRSECLHLCVCVCVCSFSQLFALQHKGNRPEDKAKQPLARGQKEEIDPNELRTPGGVECIKKKPRRNDCAPLVFCGVILAKGVKFGNTSYSRIFHNLKNKRIYREKIYHLEDTYEFLHFVNSFNLFGVIITCKHPIEKQWSKWIVNGQCKLSLWILNHGPRFLATDASLTTPV